MGTELQFEMEGAVEKGGGDGGRTAWMPGLSVTYTPKTM